MMSNITQISDFVRQERTNSLDGATKIISTISPDEGQRKTDFHESSSPPPADRVIEIPELERLTETINKAIDNGNQQLLFEVDKDTRSHIIKVVDKQTGEVIRQVPGEELLSVRKALKEGMEKDQTPIGLLLDTKV
jgi:flagellar protein FlaG